MHNYVSLDLQEFLEECESELQQEFYTSCSFPNTFDYQKYLMETIAEIRGILDASARELISIKVFSSTESGKSVAN